MHTQSKALGRAAPPSASSVASDGRPGHPRRCGNPAWTMPEMNPLQPLIPTIRHARCRVRMAIILLLVSAIGPAEEALPQNAVNLLANPGFEDGERAWKAKLSKSVGQGVCVAADAHSGNHVFRIANRVKIEWEQHGSIEQVVNGLKPATEYEVSAWVKTTNSSRSTISGGRYDWDEVFLPANTATWQRVAAGFRTEPDQTSARIRICARGAVDELLIDDVTLSEAQAPSAEIYPAVIQTSADTAPGFVLTPGAYQAGTYDQTERITGAVTIRLPAAYVGGQLSLSTQDAARPEKVLGTITLPAVPAQSTVTTQFCLSACWCAPGRLLVRLAGLTAPLAEVTIGRRDVADLIAAQTADNESRLVHLRQQAMMGSLLENAYVRLGIGVAERFIARVKQPDIRDKQQDSWTLLQARETAQILDATEGVVRTPLPTVPPISFAPLHVDRGVLVDEAGSPAFFGGYATTNRDLVNMSTLGVSFMQIEKGPNSLTADGKGGLGNVTSVVDRMKAARAAGVRVDMLLSPHWFPDWARQEAPDLATDRRGGLDYVIDHPVARRAIEQWLRAVVPAIKDQPALTTVCLANEPDYWWSGRDPFSKPLWIAYLTSKFGTVTALNDAYGTTYADFDHVQPPSRDTPGFAKPVGARRAYYDWVVFNADHFAAWMRWMHRIIKEGAPNVLTQIKVTIPNAIQHDAFGLGIDHEVMCGITDLAGCDCATWPPGFTSLFESEDPAAAGPAYPLYAYAWQTEAICYDLLRAFAHQPIVNSENHVINDGYDPPVPMAYLRSVMWQGVLHGQAGTSCWTFNESGKWRNGDYGSIYFRPAAIYGAGRAWLDARRCASQVAAVVRAKPQVAILYSRHSLFWQPGYDQTLMAAYTALSFLGEPVTFVTERQLAEGRAPTVRAVLLPQATHVANATVTALAEFAGRGGKLIAFGEGNLSHDENSRLRSLPVTPAMRTVPASANERVVFDALVPITQELGITARLVDAQTGTPAFGVEYRIVRDQGRTFLSALNQLKQTQVVWISGLTARSITDLLSGGSADCARITLVPMVPVLFDLGSGGEEP